MNIDQRSEGAVYITMDDQVYYFDDSTGEHIVQRWPVGSEDDDLVQRLFFFNEDDIMTIEAALREKADSHRQNRQDNVDDAVVAYCNSVLMRVEMQKGEG
tara:strand:+ start:452 stop:751 length:300 start_codon:yes stop_codon:yes gene_type:complete